MIDPAMAQRMFSFFAWITMPDKSVEAVHLLLESTGGFIADGIAMYNYLRAVPLPLTVYNSGSVASIGVIAFLGATRRKASPTSPFMLHRSTSSPPPITGALKLEQYAKGLRLDDERTERILRSQITLPEDKWQVFENADLYRTPQEALAAGLVDEITEFAPLAGAQLFTI